MFTGKLNRRIVIEDNTPVQSSTGEPVEGWATFATVWAEMMKPSVAERYIGDQFAGFRGIVWRVRYRSDITNLMRVVYSSVNYDITGVYEMGYKRDLLIVSEAVL